MGLGNPGKKYLMTRHNIGFTVVDALAEDSPFQKKHQSLIQKTEIKGEPVLLAKPQTFMNLSGEAVREIMGFYKIPLSCLLVIQDDKDLTFSKMKFQKSRGHGGHNGIRNIHEELNTNQYARLKIGIGSSNSLETKHGDDDSMEETAKGRGEISDTKGKSLSPLRAGEDSRDSAKDHVLSPFNKREMSALPDLLKNAVTAVYYFIENGFEKAAGQFNRRTGEL